MVSIFGSLASDFADWSSPSEFVRLDFIAEQSVCRSMDDTDKSADAERGSRDDTRAGLFAELTMALEDAVTAAAAGQQPELDLAEIERLLGRLDQLIEQSAVTLVRLRSREFHQ